MLTFLNSYKPLIDSFITELLLSKATEGLQINSWQTDVYRRISDFAKNGKTIRGSLVLWSIERFGGSISKSDIAIAAAFELIHSGFLIHDDIMDNDRQRRGGKTIFAQYEDVATNMQIEQTEAFGKSLALCAGDLAIFLGMECLSNVSENSQLYRTIVNEFASVCIAQMQDVSFGMSHAIPSVEDVLSMYTYKTAKYTISLPILAGARIAGVPSEQISIIESIGTDMGLLFQLTDDVLNLFGDSSKSGKSVGSDLREEKKTYAYVMLMNALSASEREALKKQKDPESRTALLYTYMNTYNIRSVVTRKIEELYRHICSLIQQLSASDIVKKELLQFTVFLKQRTV